MAPAMPSSRAQMQRHVAEPEGAGGGRREHRDDVVGRGEQDADEVVVSDAVAFQHRGHERLHPLADLLGRVLVEGRRAAERSEDGGHGRAAYLARRGAKGGLGEGAHLGDARAVDTSRGEATGR